MAQHERPDDDDEDARYAPSLGDEVTRWRYTLWPTLYVSEDSTTSELLWQQALEQRAARHWLVVIWWTLLALLGIVLAIAIAVVR